MTNPSSMLTRPRSAHRLTSAIESDITEVVCEVLDVEPFEVLAGTRFREHLGADGQQVLDILVTLQCAFGVRIDTAEATRMIDLRCAVDVVLAALAAKRAEHSSDRRGATSATQPLTPGSVAARPLWQ